MDISDTLAPNSDQLDAVDLLGGSRVFTIEKVSKGNAEQPVQIHLADFPRPWRPGKSMRRVLVNCWGPETSEYVGRRVELFCDNDVQFGGKSVGGTRISRLSHIEGPKKTPLLVTRGKSAIYTVEPLPEAPSRQERTDKQPAEPMTARTRGQMFALLSDLGIEDRDAQIKGIVRVIGRPIESRSELTETEAAQVINRLKLKKAERDANADAVEPGLFEQGGLDYGKAHAMEGTRR